MTAVFSVVSYECPACFCSTVEQYIFSHVHRDHQNGMVVWCVWISCGRKKSLMNIHKQLQNVCMSVLLIKTLSLVLHKLHVLRKPQQCSVIHSIYSFKMTSGLETKLAIKGSGRNNINVLGCFKGYVPCSLTEHYLTVKQELCSSFLSCY